MTDGEERRYNAREAAEQLGVRRETVIDHAHRLFGPRRAPGTPFRLTREQVEQIGQAIAERRRAPVYATRRINPP